MDFPYQLERARVYNDHAALVQTTARTTAASSSTQGSFTLPATVFSHTTGVITPGAEPQTSLPLSESLYIPLLFGGLYGGLYERLSELLSSANRFPLKFEAKRLFADFWRGQPRDVETFRRRLLYFVWRVTNETH
jgi:hypothetical protein